MNISKNQYIYKLQLTRSDLLTDGPTEQEAAIFEEHVSYLEALAEQSKVLLAGRTQTDEPSGFGIIILNTDTEGEAMNIVRNDPAVKHGVMQAEFFPYRIAVSPNAIVRSADQ